MRDKKQAIKIGLAQAEIPTIRRSPSSQDKRSEMQRDGAMLHRYFSDRNDIHERLARGRKNDRETSASFAQSPQPAHGAGEGVFLTSNLIMQRLAPVHADRDKIERSEQRDVSWRDCRAVCDEA